MLQNLSRIYSVNAYAERNADNFSHLYEYFGKSKKLLFKIAKFTYPIFTMLIMFLLEFLLQSWNSSSFSIYIIIKTMKIIIYFRSVFFDLLPTVTLGIIITRFWKIVKNSLPRSHSTYDYYIIHIIISSPHWNSNTKNFENIENSKYLHDAYIHVCIIGILKKC